MKPLKASIYGCGYACHICRQCGEEKENAEIVHTGIPEGAVKRTAAMNFARSAELFAQREGCVPNRLTGEKKENMMNITIKKMFNRNINRKE